MNSVIDLTKLTKSPEIHCELMPDGLYWATDRATFDGDPESRWHITGRGKTKREAIYDLLEGLTEVSQEPPQRFEQIMGINTREEPADFRPARDETDEDGLPL